MIIYQGTTPSWNYVKVEKGQHNSTKELSGCPAKAAVALRHSTTDHWIQESIKRIFSPGLFWAVGSAEKKNPNCHKYATFEVSFFMFSWSKNFFKYFSDRTKKLHSINLRKN